MCGIAGIVSLSGGEPPRIAQLSRMLAALGHRGPDESGLYRDATAGLVHARLSIVDLKTGGQPLANEDETLWVVFNGEIYNYPELRTQLVALGHVFRTRSDTEVVVHAWEQWGEDALSRFNGQWAFALWDARRRRLVLSRDRLGIRPLYVTEQRGRLLFASEVKALFAAAPEMTRAIDPTALVQTLSFWTVVAPRTLFVGVEELEPGHVRSCSADARADRAYFELRYPEPGEGRFAGSVDQAASAVHAALEQATALRMLRADVPVGSYLSGGLDSSLIATLGLAAMGSRFQTFSIRFEDAEYDETPFQQLMVRRLGSEHHELVVSQGDIARAFPDVVWHAERPLLRTAPAPLFLLSRLVRQAGIKVVLTGEGADEMFCGYDLFREGKVRRFWARHPDSKLRPLLLRRLYPYLARSPVRQQALAEQFFGRDLEHADAPGFAHGPRWQNGAALRRLLSEEVANAAPNVVGELVDSLPPAFRTWSPLAQDQYLEIRTLLSGYLLSSQGDRMLMAHSVEGRFPFLDCDVVELAGSLPDRYKLSVLDEKHVLKRLSRDLLPDPIVERSKQPYRAPDAQSFVDARAPDWVGAVIEPRAVAEAGLFDARAVARLFDKCRLAGARGKLSNADNMALTAVLSTQLLNEQFVRRPPPVRAAPAFNTFIDRQGP